MSGETAGKPIGDLCLLLLVELVHIILELVDPGTDRERDADCGDDGLSPVEGLDLDLHPRKILFCAAQDDLPVALVTEPHHHEGIDLGEYLGVHVLRLLGDYTEADAELPSFHRTLPEDLGGRAATREHPLSLLNRYEHLVTCLLPVIDPVAPGFLPVLLHNRAGDDRKDEKLAALSHVRDVDEDYPVVMEVFKNLGYRGSLPTEERGISFREIVDVTLDIPDRATHGVPDQPCKTAFPDSRGYRVPDGKYLRVYLAEEPDDLTARCAGKGFNDIELRG